MTPKAWKGKVAGLGCIAEQLQSRAEPVTESGCLIWLGPTNAGGYGRIHLNGERFAAHREAWKLAWGPIPAGLYVCHRCDVPVCVRADHLFLGTHLENTMDAVMKGRMNVVPAQVAAKLANIGRPLSAAHRKVLSNQRLGIPLSLAHREHIASGQHGRRHTDETREKMRQAALHREQEKRKAL